METQTIYMDNNATTMTDQAVLEEMLPYFSQLYGNPSSMHSFGGQVAEKINQARQRVANLLGCKQSEIIFTSGGTESDNSAIMGTLSSYPQKRKIITSRVEHPAVLMTCRELENHGYTVIEIPVDRNGALDMAQFEAELDEDTAIVSIMWANNETGVIFDVEQIAQMCAAKGVPFHTDAVQAIGKIPIDLSNSAISMLSLSGHKLHGPKGIGVLYVKKGTRLSPFILGGHQEHGRRAGTENTAGIIGLGKACQIADEFMEKENTEVKQLRDKLESGIVASCPDCMVNGEGMDRLPNTSNISFEFIEGEAILLMINRFGICASSGSACTSGSLEPSHVLRAMGVPFTAAHGSIRFSLSRYNTQQEVDTVIENIPPIINRLRELSPFVKS